MYAQRVSVIALFCAIILMASSLIGQPQGSGPRAELGPQVTEPHPDFGVIDGKHYVNSYFGFSYRYPEGWNGFDVLHTDKQYTFAGKQFYRVDLVSKSTPGSPVFYQTQVFMLSPNYAVTFTFMAVNSDDMDTLIRSMESLSFEQKPIGGAR